jgi:hypothetical protein
MENERSKCVVCGRVRKRSFLKLYFRVWVCDSEKTWNNANYRGNWVKNNNNINTRFHECQIDLFKMHQKIIKTEIEKYNNEVDKLLGNDYDYFKEQLKVF